MKCPYYNFVRYKLVNKVNNIGVIELEKGQKQTFLPNKL